MPELDVLLRDPPIPTPRRRDGSAPIFVARRESSSTHAAPTLLARREPSSAHSAPSLVPALDALEFDAPNGGRPRRSLPNLIPEPGRAPAARPVAEPPPRVAAPAEAPAAPVPKDSPAPAPVPDHPSLLPIGLAATQPAAVTPAPAPQASVAASLPQLPPIRQIVRANHRRLGIGVALALLAFIVVRLAWYANRQSDVRPELASADTPVDPPAAVDPPPAPPPATSIPAEPPPPPPRAHAAPLQITCPEGHIDDPAIGLLAVPFTPVAGQPVRLLAATLTGDSPLSLHLPGTGDVLESQVRPDAPVAVIAEWTPAVAAEYTVAVADADGVRACRTLVVESAAPEVTRISPSGRIWPVERAWTGAEEALYSAWVRELFRGPDVATVARLDLLTADPARNLLHGALRLGEDDADDPDALELRPGGADLPYFLRAYWSWKRRLPFAYRKCNRGGDDGKPPRCGDPRYNLAPGPGYSGKEDELERVRRFFLRNISWGVYPGNVRTAHGDSNTDLYPVRLDRRALRPGAVYADPHGQAFVVVDLVSARDGEPGALLVAGSRPDGALARRRFWEGEFLWDPNPARGGTGFKQFRPVVRRGSGLAQLDDATLGASPDFGDIWTGHVELGGRAFFDAVAALLEPPPWDAARIQRDALAALSELARARVEPVARAAEYARSRRVAIAMPRGAALFDGAGSWESHSTPGRDLRLLVALDAVRGFPDRVREHPELFTTGDDVEATARALELEREEIFRDPENAITYTRSDGSAWSLSLRDLLDRSEALELAYNPNDCPELRWGAPQGSDELATCSFRAPEDQRARMELYRGWFRQRRLPAPGEKAP